MLFLALFLGLSFGNCTFSEGPLKGTYGGYVHSTFGLQEYSDFRAQVRFLNSRAEQDALCLGTLQDFNVSGLIVGFVVPQITTRVPEFFLERDGCAYETMVASVTKANAAGLLQFGQGDVSDGFEILARDWWDCRNCTSQKLVNDTSGDRLVKFPVFVCLLDDLSPLFWFNLSDTPVRLDSSLSAFSVVSLGYGVFFRVFFSFWTLVNVICGIIFLIKQISDHRKPGKGTKNRKFPELAVAALSFEIFCNILRFVYVVVDPLWITTVWPAPVHLIFGTGAFSFSLCATLLIAVFWFKSIKLTNRQIKLLSDCGSLALLIFLFLVILGGEYIPGALRVAFRDIQQTSQTLFITAVFACVFYSVLALFFLSTGVRVIYSLRKARKIKSTDGKFAAMELRLLLFVVFDSICMICLSGVFFLVAGQGFLTVEGFFTSWTVIWCFQCAISSLQIFIFKPDFGFRKAKKIPATKSTAISSYKEETKTDGVSLKEEDVEIETAAEQSIATSSNDFVDYGDPNIVDL